MFPSNPLYTPKKTTQSGGWNLGQSFRNTFGFDPTPNFNLSSTAGDGIPFVNKSASAPQPMATVETATNTIAPPPEPPPSDPYVESGPSAAEQAEMQNTLFGIDTGISSAQSGLGRLDGQRETGRGNITREYEAAANMLLGKRKLGQQQFDQNTTTQLNEFMGAKNNVADGARSFMNGARGTLGSQGAGAGSKARYVVPFEAQSMAAKGNAEAQSTNNQNITRLTQAWNGDQQAIDNEDKRIAGSRDQGMRDLDGRIESSRAELLNTVAQLTGQKNILNGGNWQSAKAAANPFLTQIPGVLDNIDALSSTVPIAAQDISLSKPDLSGYNFARPGAAPQPVQDPTLSGSPVMAALMGGQQQRRQPLLPGMLPEDKLQYA